MCLHERPNLGCEGAQKVPSIFRVVFRESNDKVDVRIGVWLAFIESCVDHGGRLRASHHVTWH